MKPVLWVVVLSLAGCTTTTQTIEVQNRSSATVTKFSLEDPRGFSFNFGGLAPGVPRGYGGRMSARPKDTFTARWIDANGRSHQVPVTVPRGIRGDVIFILNNDGTVSVKRRGR